MPAHPDLVTLDHAKDWAKRLAKVPFPIDRLANAQQAVAAMLGHASWHALERYHRGATAPAAAGSPPPTPSDASSSYPVDAMVRLAAFINRRYPGLNAEEVEELALDVDLCKGTPECIVERARELENDGHFPEDALEKALADLTVRVQLPQGHMMIRVRQVDGNQAMVLLPAEEYDAALGCPAPSTARRSCPAPG